ncbi:MAG TPA: DUF4142 domain-containing protein [Fimbriimonadaceae bacterium]|nr:DUF4142 domain-containing protein [Fimbriimonadaceae bacterium]
MIGKAKILLGAAFILCGVYPALAQTSTIHTRSNLSVASSANMARIKLTTSLNRRDRNFLAAIAQGNRDEIRLGELAERQGGPWGRAFGRDMQREHGLLLAQLKKTAQKQGIGLPTDIDAKTKESLRWLSRFHGAAFDRAYREKMIQDHRAALAAVQSEIDHGRSANVRDYAVIMEPAIKLHLKNALQRTTMIGAN